jgi:AraC-like DNA-binding protein
MRFYSLLLYPSFFADVEKEGLCFTSIVSSDEFVRECFEEMRREYVSGERMSDMMLKSCAYRLVAYLGRKYSIDKAARTDTGNLTRLHTLLQYIENNYYERITTKELASLSFITEEHLCRFFKKTVGKTVSEYVNQYRVEKAAILLANTEDAIGNIGATVGFEDTNYFTRVFKRVKGVTPREYRRIIP